ncbi:Hypothetical protein FKW44_018366 [Caligus rogercresseyi]|uniref:Uncharacterized protein n=1 Tax=Caligus rogercresseyi TaxID=217165 RepID=A0A7T8GUA1_CALRO|nr:Hypothetical protein FKW44_018366 [Caligus rogercresseyi]
MNTDPSKFMRVIAWEWGASDKIEPGLVIEGQSLQDEVESHLSLINLMGHLS